MTDDERFAMAREVASTRIWGDTEDDALAKRYLDTALQSMVDLLRIAEPLSFKAGVRAAVQAMVDDVAGLVKRRERAMANKDTTNIIAGIGRRIATLPMPQREEDMLPAISRDVLFAKVAQKIRPDLNWSSVASLTPEGFFVDDGGAVVEGNADFLAAWRFAESLVEMIRYA